MTIKYYNIIKDNSPVSAGHQKCHFFLIVISTLFFLPCVMSAEITQPDPHTSSPKTTIALPLKLIDFTARPSYDIILVKWITRGELNVNHFELEQSTNGQTFKCINKQTGKGVRMSSEVYQAEDFSPSANINFYRLKVVRNDGRTAYSKVITIQRKRSQ